jgi:ribosomal protein L16 Arg81 hydroxylase
MVTSAPHGYVPSFEELAGDKSKFFQSYFDKAPLLRRAALRADPELVLSISDLDEILRSKAIRFPHVQILRHGDDVPADEFTQSLQEGDKSIPGTIIPGRVVEYFRRGSTITWSALHHVRPNMRDLALMLSEEFASHTGVTAVLTPANKQGFYPHCDPSDVFVVQLRGTKYWRVWPAPQTRKGDEKHFSASGEELGDPIIETTLSPGDILYLPNGTPHVAATGNEVSLHIGAMVRPVRWSELLTLIVAEIVDNDRDFTDVAYLSQSRHEALAESLSSHVQALMRQLAELDRSDAIRRVMALSRPKADLPAPEPLTDLSRADSISTATNVRRNPYAIIEDRGMTQESKRGRVSVDGKLYEMPVSAANALLGLNITTELPAGEFLKGRPAESSARVVQQLCRIGALEMCG